MNCQVRGLRGARKAREGTREDAEERPTPTTRDDTRATKTGAAGILEAPPTPPEGGPVSGPRADSAQHSALSVTGGVPLGGNGVPGEPGRE